MDKSAILKKAESIFTKYKYALLILVIGLVLMLIPGKSETDSQQPTEVLIQNTVSVEERLSNLLSALAGAGRVQVLLTESTGEETVYQIDQESNSGNDTSSVKITTVIVTDSQRSESGLIKQVNPPSYLGAVVLCQGADNMTVRYAIVEAVCKATGLGADKVSVLKMK